jgi:hypothetical protein
MRSPSERLRRVSRMSWGQTRRRRAHPPRLPTQFSTDDEEEGQESWRVSGNGRFIWTGDTHLPSQKPNKAQQEQHTKFWEVYDAHLPSLPVRPRLCHGLAPALNYGMQCYEGMKAFRAPNNTINIFRPNMNSERMQHSASCVAMPTVPTDHYLECCSLAIAMNAAYVPPHETGTVHLPSDAR